MKQFPLFVLPNHRCNHVGELDPGRHLGIDEKWAVGQMRQGLPSN